jgi:hypothetical protein
MKIKGILLVIDGKAYVRQYTKDGEFRDILVVHDDLNIEIDDESATIRIDKNGESYIDYTDGVLGRPDAT